MGPPWGSHVFTYAYIGNMYKNIFLSKTTRYRALIFSMCYNLVDIYQVCSNYATGTKNGLAPGITCIT